MRQRLGSDDDLVKNEEENNRARQGTSWPKKRAVPCTKVAVEPRGRHGVEDFCFLIVGMFGFFWIFLDLLNFWDVFGCWRLFVLHFGIFRFLFFWKTLYVVRHVALGISFLRNQ